MLFILYALDLHNKYFFFFTFLVNIKYWLIRPSLNEMEVVIFIYWLIRPLLKWNGSGDIYLCMILSVSWSTCVLYYLYCCCVGLKCIFLGDKGGSPLWSFIIICLKLFGTSCAYEYICFKLLINKNMMFKFS